MEFWKKNELEIIRRERKKGSTVEEISKIIKRTPRAIECKAHSIGALRYQCQDKTKYSFSIKSPIDVAGICLWWGEGTKPYLYNGKRKFSRVEIVNSDPRMIKLFLKFLLKHGDRVRIRFRIHAHTNSYLQQLNYWIRTTGFNKRFFKKPIIKLSVITKKGYHGCIEIRYNSTGMARAILNFINEELIRI